MMLSLAWTLDLGGLVYRVGTFLTFLLYYALTNVKCCKCDVQCVNLLRIKQLNTPLVHFISIFDLTYTPTVGVHLLLRRTYLLC